ncbi:MAG: subclass B3 metallo-beta-lactamase [Lysobacter sp.]|nr:subclass B3 metallo-beta-lactamase [Lysobacter sp.]
MPSLRSTALALTLSLIAAGSANAAEPLLPEARAYPSRDSWRQPVAPFRIAERSWYIGTAGLSAVLVKTDAGAVLIDTGLPQAGDMLLQRMRELGVQPSDLKLILHSHAHIDHIGALAQIQRATGAQVIGNAEAAVLLARGGSDDIHFGEGMLFAPAQVQRLIMDGETVELGGMRFTPHFTPAHTPGSTSWTWDDRIDGKNAHIAYVDSLSAPDYQLVGNPRYPRIVDDYRRGFAAVRALPCDLLLSPHPDASGWDPADTAAPHKTPTTCRAYADKAERALDKTVAEQTAKAKEAR